MRPVFLSAGSGMCTQTTWCKSTCECICTAGMSTLMTILEMHTTRQAALKPSPLQTSLSATSASSPSQSSTITMYHCARDVHGPTFGKAMRRCSFVIGEGMSGKAVQLRSRHWSAMTSVVCEMLPGTFLTESPQLRTRTGNFILLTAHRRPVVSHQCIASRVSPFCLSDVVACIHSHCLCRCISWISLHHSCACDYPWWFATALPRIPRSPPGVADHLVWAGTPAQRLLLW